MNKKESLANTNEIIINFSELLTLLKKNFIMIIISILICVTISGTVTLLFIDKQYESTSRLFLKPEIAEGFVDYSQINFNNSMVNNYVEILKGNNIQNKVATKLNLDIKEIQNCLTIFNETNTQIISINAKTTNAVKSKKIVDTVVDIFIKQVKETLNVNNITVVDQAIIPTEPISPNLKHNLLISAGIGVTISTGYLFIKFLFGSNIHNKEEAEKYLGIPVLGSIPYFKK